MFKFRVLTTTVALLACSPAAAQNCQTMAAAKAETEAQSTALGGVVLTLFGKEASDYLAVVNAVPPETHLAAASIMLFSIPGRGAVIGLILDGHVCIAGRIGYDVHEKALKAARGEGV
jgi:hypothetical protein